MNESELIAQLKRARPDIPAPRLKQRILTEANSQYSFQPQVSARGASLGWSALAAAWLVIGALHWSTPDTARLCGLANHQGASAFSRVRTSVQSPDVAAAWLSHAAFMQPEALLARLLGEAGESALPGLPGAPVSPNTSPLRTQTPSPL